MEFFRLFRQGKSFFLVSVLNVIYPLTQMYAVEGDGRDRNPLEQCLLAFGVSSDLNGPRPVSRGNRILVSTQAGHVLTYEFSYQGDMNDHRLQRIDLNSDQPEAIEAGSFFTRPSELGDATINSVRLKLSPDTKYVSGITQRTVQKSGSPHEESVTILTVSSTETTQSASQIVFRQQLEVLPVAESSTVFENLAGPPPTPPLPTSLMHAWIDNKYIVLYERRSTGESILIVYELIRDAKSKKISLSEVSNEKDWHGNSVMVGRKEHEGHLGSLIHRRLGLENPLDEELLVGNWPRDRNEHKVVWTKSLPTGTSYTDSFPSILIEPQEPNPWTLDKQGNLSFTLISPLNGEVPGFNSISDDPVLKTYPISNAVPPIIVRIPSSTRGRAFVWEHPHLLYSDSTGGLNVVVSLANEDNDSSEPTQTHPHTQFGSTNSQKLGPARPKDQPILYTAQVNENGTITKKAFDLKIGDETFFDVAQINNVTTAMVITNPFEVAKNSEHTWVLFGTKKGTLFVFNAHNRKFVGEFEFKTVKEEPRQLPSETNESPDSRSVNESAPDQLSANTEGRGRHGRAIRDLSYDSTTMTIYATNRYGELLSVPFLSVAGASPEEKYGPTYYRKLPSSGTRKN